jgi:hypothetical protein
MISPAFAEESYRPSYPFNDDVFALLPSFPHDFFEIKMLFDRGRITASQLGGEYLQPELIPTWGFFSERIYGDENFSHFGRYGLSFYPSFVNFKNVEAGDIINISLIFRADWGIRFYQGCRIVIPDVEGLDIELVHPGSYDVLLMPTYPQFVPGWMSDALFRITVLETGDYHFIIRDGKPSRLSSNTWSDLYGENYTDVGSLTYAPIIIDIRQPFYEQVMDENISFEMKLFIVFLFVFLILCIITFYIQRRLDEKKRKG